MYIYVCVCICIKYPLAPWIFKDLGSYYLNVNNDYLYIVEAQMTFIFIFKLLGIFLKLLQVCTTIIREKNKIISILKARGIVVMVRQYFSGSVHTCSTEAQCLKIYPNYSRRLQGLSHMYPETSHLGYHISLPFAASPLMTSLRIPQRTSVLTWPSKIPALLLVDACQHLSQGTKVS